MTKVQLERKLEKAQTEIGSLKKIIEDERVANSEGALHFIELDFRQQGVELFAAQAQIEKLEKELSERDEVRTSLLQIIENLSQAPRILTNKLI